MGWKATQNEWRWSTNNCKRKTSVSQIYSGKNYDKRCLAWLLHGCCRFFQFMPSHRPLLSQIYLTGTGVFLARAASWFFLLLKCFSQCSVAALGATMLCEIQMVSTAAWTQTERGEAEEGLQSGVPKVTFRSPNSPQLSSRAALSLDGTRGATYMRRSRKVIFQTMPQLSLVL